jgi:hypothetical protein
MTGRKIVDTSVAVSSTVSEIIFVPSSTAVVAEGSGGAGDAMMKKSGNCSSRCISLLKRNIIISTYSYYLNLKAAQETLR